MKLNLSLMVIKFSHLTLFGLECFNLIVMLCTFSHLIQNIGKTIHFEIFLYPMDHQIMSNLMRHFIFMTQHFSSFCSHYFYNSDNLRFYFPFYYFTTREHIDLNQFFDLILLCPLCSFKAFLFLGCKLQKL